MTIQAVEQAAAKMEPAEARRFTEAVKAGRVRIETGTPGIKYNMVNQRATITIERETDIQGIVKGWKAIEAREWLKD